MRCTPFSPEKGLTVIREGRSEYRIVISRHASRSTEHGAIELQRFFHEMTGAVLPIVSDAMPATECEIVLGKSSRLDSSGIDIDFQSLGDEGYVIRTVGRRLVIAGGDLRGTMYGVYGLLEDHLGCRWYRHDVSRIPQMYTLIVPEMNETKKPLIEYREPYTWEAFDGDWAARNRMNRNSLSGGLEERHGGKVEWVTGMFVHTFAKLVPPEKYFRSHPEYFSLVNGRRLSRRSQLCCTNEDVVQIVTEGVLRAFRENPQAQVISVSQNDWFNNCQCPKCRALAEKEGSDIAPVLQLVNRVAEAVEEEFPDKIIETLAYQWTRKPPKTIRPRHNVVIRLCTIECCFSHPLATCDSEENRAFADDLRAWSKVTDRLWVWNYVTSFAHYFVPYPNLRVRDDNIRFFAEHNVTAVFQQDVYSTPGGELSGLSAWLNAKLLWDPYYDEDIAIDDYLTGVFGPAAGSIRKYIDILHDRVERDNIHMGIWQGPEAEYLSRDILDCADALWDEAESAVARDPDILRRVRQARLSLDYAVLTQGKTRGTAYLIDHENLSVRVDPRYFKRLDSFCAVAREAGVIKLKEYNYTIDEFRADIEKSVKSQSFKYLGPLKKNGTDPGVVYKYFDGTWKKLPDFNQLKPVKTGTVKRFRLPFTWADDADEEIYGFTFAGYIDLPRNGVYSFFTVSDGYAELKVGGRKIIHNGGNDPLRERCGFAALREGRYPIEVLFFTREGGNRLEVYYAGPGMERREISGDILTH